MIFYRCQISNEWLSPFLDYPFFIYTPGIAAFYEYITNYSVYVQLPFNNGVRSTIENICKAHGR